MNKPKQKGETNKAEIDILKKELEEKRKTADEFKNKYLRALADYQNLEKRMLQTRNEVADTACVNLITVFLPFLDNLEKAELFSKDQGLKMIKDELINNIRASGFEELNILGRTFDPNLAEAIEVVEGKEDDKVVEVLRKGYIFKGRLVRPAQVKVSKKAENPNPKSETNSK